MCGDETVASGVMSASCVVISGDGEDEDTVVMVVTARRGTRRALLSSPLSLGQVVSVT